MLCVMKFVLLMGSVRLFFIVSVLWMLLRFVD